VLLNQVKHYFVGRKITLVGYLVQNLNILVVILIKVILADIEKRIPFDPEGLMYLEIKTN
jgi:hypothetical protein